MYLTRPLPVRAATASPSRRLVLFVTGFAVNFLVLASPLRAQEQAAAAVPAAAAARREVLLTVTVTDGAGNYVTGLGREHFEVSEGKAPSAITSFSTSEEAASVVVLLDMSGSSTSSEGRAATWDVLRRAFVAFGRRSPRENEYTLLTFNKKLAELTDWTRDPLLIAEALAALDPKAVPDKDERGTALYDACAASLAKFARASRRKRVLLIFTDGLADNASRRTRLGGLKKLVRESGALVYAVAFDPHLTRPRSFGEDGGLRDLHDLTAVSGGYVYLAATPADANAVAERIAAELRRQYVIGIAPAAAAKPGELNKVKVRINPPPLKRKIFFRSPDGYHTAPD